MILPLGTKAHHFDHPHCYSQVDPGTLAITGAPVMSCKHEERLNSAYTWTGDTALCGPRCLGNKKAAGVCWRREWRRGGTEPAGIQSGGVRPVSVKKHNYLDARARMAHAMALSIVPSLILRKRVGL
ncbi:hypothetical protein T310_6798 [Rasamsonia emersonii CBS 393.64]|uniref:Uncharacterized protein n=1 Tax=Rasamsonia emersonii (strain ATCC 16479 / CBS 393.64 / IMI 116815) TaxID=1408163 RepID=A0A0F4YNM9_RASE3|nr:hypothetical protein T310_6798 [Rasamsonia emersonii CBS 393.64]KKA19238.1 hypothetical protein T310_6798 [Rasamsonia emersonii CBS 393.64]